MTQVMNFKGLEEHTNKIEFPKDFDVFEHIKINFPNLVIFWDNIPVVR